MRSGFDVRGSWSRALLRGILAASIVVAVGVATPTLPGGAAADGAAVDGAAADGKPADVGLWSFRPVERPELPGVRDAGWVRDDLDRFILAKIEAAGLEPHRDADRYALIRRAAFDLIGLPPTPDEVAAFVNDPAPTEEAFARVVDRYLDSPCFGERWGRHWLDVVRYADSVGQQWNAPFTYAWRYRNYVIDAFNADTPYDRFIVEQLAGDRLPADTTEEERKTYIATGLLTLSSLNIQEGQSESFMMDRVDEQIDVTTRAFMALTVACARCHDHKYDPITMRDYYALAGIFYSSETLSGQQRLGDYVDADSLLLLPDGSAEPTPLTPGVHSMSDIKREHSTGGWREVLYTTDPNLAMAVVEGEIRDCEIRIDGDPYNYGSVPPRGDVRINGLPKLPPIPADASGRLTLARWIASPENPLTARVMVNRVWQHLFGRGLSRSVDNFGFTGEEPTHPELLDHLAVRFVEDGWSVKKLIRQIMLSRTYRLSSGGHADNEKIDPQNELYWRMNIKRLEVEPLRDTMLDAAGRLRFQRPTGIQVAGTGGHGQWGRTRSLLDIDSPYRTVYLPVLRSLLPPMYETFDFPEPSQVQGQRAVTTVAPQALFLLNSDFAADCASDAARRLLEDRYEQSADPTAERIRAAYLRLLSRPPESDEIEAARDFLESLNPPNRDPELYRWAALVQALMASGEFRSVL